MNSCATGVSIRPFSVISPIGARVLGKAIGSALSRGCHPGTFSMKLGSTVRKRPLARKSFFRYSEWVTTVGLGGSCQRVARRGQYGERIVKQHLCGELGGQRAEHSADRQLDIPLHHLAVEPYGIVGDDVKAHARVFSRQAVD